MIQCKNCGKELQDGAQFCGKCGAKVEADVQAPKGFCSKCGAPLKPDNTFCTKCGAPVKRDRVQSRAGASSNAGGLGAVSVVPYAIAVLGFIGVLVGFFGPFVSTSDATDFLTSLLGASGGISFSLPDLKNIMDVSGLSSMNDPAVTAVNVCFISFIAAHILAGLGAGLALAKKTNSVLFIVPVAILAVFGIMIMSSMQNSFAGYLIQLDSGFTLPLVFYIICFVLAVFFRKKARPQ